MTDISKALKIPGWMSEQELMWLAEQASKCRSIAEIGSWRGRSARAMADNTPGMVVCVDTWQDSAFGLPGWWSTPEDNAKHQEKDWLWNEFTQNIDGHLNYRICPLRLSSLEAAVYLSRYLKFDLIFIDADHEEKSVREDIKAWRPLLKTGGILCGHDYGHPDCPGVKIAVDALLPNVKVHDTIWYEI